MCRLDSMVTSQTLMAPIVTPVRITKNADGDSWRCRRRFGRCAPGAVMQGMDLHAGAAITLDTVASAAVAAALGKVGSAVSLDTYDKIKDAAEITAIVGADVDAHGFEPSPSDARRLGALPRLMLTTDGYYFDSTVSFMEVNMDKKLGKRSKLKDSV